jgi:hypothetical protein
VKRRGCREQQEEICSRLTGILRCSTHSFEQAIECCIQRFKYAMNLEVEIPF